MNFDKPKVKIPKRFSKKACCHFEVQHLPNCWIWCKSVVNPIWPLQLEEDIVNSSFSPGLSQVVSLQFGEVSSETEGTLSCNCKHSLVHHIAICKEDSSLWVG